jgi:ABC-type phosphate transport system substrate-binding protein
MLKKNALIALAAFGIGASGSGSTAAAQALPVYGSDTLFDVTTKAINDCVAAGALPANSLSYKGTGSSQGGKAMNGGDAAAVPPFPAQNQQIAPQSRFLSSAECSFFSSNAGQGTNIGLDALAVVADNSAPANTCNDVRYTGSSSGFTFDDWRDVLRLVYTGQTAKVTADPCSPADPARTPAAPGNIAGGRCDSPLRQALLASWGELFEGGCTNGKCPNGLRHAFRRDDVSGTTDTFLTLLGLPAATTRTFCNGFDNEDLDPVRRPCDANEQVCTNIPYASRNANPNGAAPTAAATNPAAAGGDLGVVLSVTMPTNTAFQYGPPCALGKFAYTSMPFAASAEAQRCPDGNARQGGKCRYPTTAAGKFNCRAVLGTRPPISTFTNMDGRSFNLIPRDPDTGVILLASTGITDPRWGGGGSYRLHQTAAMANGSGTCIQTDATRQIGCLVNSDPCSIGYAGREAITWNGAATPVKGLRIRSPLTPGVAVGPTEADTLLLLDPSGPTEGTCGNGAGDNFGFRYSLSRKLWINASKGFGNFTTFPSISNTTANGVVANENQFMQCVANRGNGITDTAISTFGFIRIPASAAFPNKTCP